MHHSRPTTLEHVKKDVGHRYVRYIRERYRRKRTAIEIEDKLEIEWGTQSLPLSRAYSTGYYFDTVENQWM